MFIFEFTFLETLSRYHEMLIDVLKVLYYWFLGADPTVILASQHYPVCPLERWLINHKTIQSCVFKCHLFALSCVWGCDKMTSNVAARIRCPPPQQARMIQWCHNLNSVSGSRMAIKIKLKKPWLPNWHSYLISKEEYAIREVRIRFQLVCDKHELMISMNHDVHRVRHSSHDLITHLWVGKKFAEITPSSWISFEALS